MIDWTVILRSGQQQFGTFSPAEAQARNQSAQCGRVWLSTHTSLEVGNATLAQPGRVGELLLRQSGRFAVPAHERAHLRGTISERAHSAWLRALGVMPTP